MGEELGLVQVSVETDARILTNIIAPMFMSSVVKFLVLHSCSEQILNFWFNTFLARDVNIIFFLKKV